MTEGPRGDRGRRRGWGYGPGSFGGRRARRGDARTAALLLLNEEPRNGYQIMQEIEERSNGLWRPSPGSIYPALQQLEDEGLVRQADTGAGKVYELTDQGKRQVAARADDLPAPWEEMAGGGGTQVAELKTVLRQVAMAFAEVMRAGSPAQHAEALKVLARARRELYSILGDGDPEGDEEA